MINLIHWMNCFSFIHSFDMMHMLNGFWHKQTHTTHTYIDIIVKAFRTQSFCFATAREEKKKQTNGAYREHVHIRETSSYNYCWCHKLKRYPKECLHHMLLTDHLLNEQSGMPILHFRHQMVNIFIAQYNPDRSEECRLRIWCSLHFTTLNGVCR